jgi:NAD-dependent deacetylase
MPFALPDGLLETLGSAESIAVLTGAGISAESGIPTFRDAQTGLWAQYSAMELATPEAFERSPRLVWEWYEMRRGLCLRADPNHGHRALALLEQRVPVFSLTTQNVDGLHQRAGSTSVLELHGSIMRQKCFETEAIWDGPIPETDDPPPRHPETGGWLRPDVVWFGEPLPERIFEKSLRAAESADVYLTIGTSGLVHPAAGLPMAALRSGATVIEINPAETPFTAHATFSIRGAAGTVLTSLLQMTGGPSPRT